MIKIDRKVFENLIDKIVNSTDIRKILNEFSGDYVFFSSFLKDIAKGEYSPNYDLLKKLAKDRKVSEQYIIEQARIILKYLTKNEPKEDYYKILKVLPSSSSEEIRKSWLSLIKLQHPDRVGESGLEITKRLNEAYGVLGNPKKRIEYDANYQSELPLKVKTFWTMELSKMSVFAGLLVFVVFAAGIYFKESGPFFRSKKETRAIAKGKSQAQSLPSGVSSFSLIIETIPSKPEILVEEVEKVAFNPSEAITDIVNPEEKTSEKLTIAAEKKNEPEKAKSIKLSMGVEKSSHTKPEVGGVNSLLTREFEKLPNAKDEIQEKSSRENEDYVFQQKNTPEIDENKYIVKDGDNLWLIARKFDTRVNKLKAINNLTSNRLDIGDVLLIPQNLERESHVKKSVKEKTYERKQSLPIKGHTSSISNKKLAKKQEISGASKPKTRVAKEIKVSEDKVSNEEARTESLSPSKDFSQTKQVNANKLSPNVPYPDKESLLSFVSSYVSAYKSRDIAGFKSFFKQNAKENGIEISKILPSYRKNFSSLEIIKYDFNVRNAYLEDHKAFVDGDFELLFKKNNDGNIKSSRGSLNWSLAWENNGWKIEEITYRINKGKSEVENL